MTEKETEDCKWFLYLFICKVSKFITTFFTKKFQRRLLSLQDIQISIVKQFFYFFLNIILHFVPHMEAVITYCTHNLQKIPLIKFISISISFLTLFFQKRELPTCLLNKMMISTYEPTSVIFSEEETSLRSEQETFRTAQRDDSIRKNDWSATITRAVM